jgi:low affinity Fe/Cu permease
MNYEKHILKIPQFVGTTKSILIHTFLFLAIYSMLLFGVSLDTVNLTLTTLVSLEAIYLSIFIQLSVNQSSNKITAELDEITEDIDMMAMPQTTNTETETLRNELKRLSDQIAQLGSLLESKSKL